MPAPRTFVLQQMITVRVGAEVEITSFHEPKVSAWDASITGHKEEVVKHEVVLRDLETGVVYGAPWHFDGASIHPALVAAETLRGRVVACQVRSGAKQDNRFRVETWLAVEPEAESAYR